MDESIFTPIAVRTHSLSREEFARFLEACKNPPPPSERLKRLLRLAPTPSEGDESWRRGRLPPFG